MEDFIRKHENTIINYDFKPGEYILVLNKKIEPAVGQKGKPRYMGPWIVVRRLFSGAYRLAELNGALSKLKFAAFRLIPYYPQNRRVIEVTVIVDKADVKRVAVEDVEDSESESDNVDADGE